MQKVKKVNAYNLDEHLIVWIARQAGAETAKGNQTSSSAFLNEILTAVKKLDEHESGGFRVLAKKLLNGKKSIKTLKAEQS